MGGVSEDKSDTVILIFRLFKIITGAASLRKVRPRPLVLWYCSEKQHQKFVERFLSEQPVKRGDVNPAIVHS